MAFPTYALGELACLTVEVSQEEMAPIAHIPAAASSAGDWSLQNFDPVRPGWAGLRSKRGVGAASSRAIPPRRPRYASLPAKGNEIEPGPAP